MVYDYWMQKLYNVYNDDTLDMLCRDIFKQYTGKELPLFGAECKELIDKYKFRVNGKNEVFINNIKIGQIETIETPKELMDCWIITVEYKFRKEERWTEE